MAKIILVASALAFLAFSTPAYGKKAPPFPYHGTLPVLVSDVGCATDACIGRYFKEPGYTQMMGFALGPLLAAGDRSREAEAAALLLPALGDFDLTGELITAMNARLEWHRFADEVEVSRVRFGDGTPHSEAGLKLEHTSLLIWPSLQSGGDYSRLFVQIEVRLIDPDHRPYWDFGPGMIVVYEIPFHEIRAGDKRIENARQIGALGAKRVVPELRAAVESLVDMLNHELTVDDKKEKRLELYKQHISSGGAAGMRTVRIVGDRRWMTWRVMGDRWALYSVPN